MTSFTHYLLLLLFLFFLLLHLIDFVDNLCPLVFLDISKQNGLFHFFIEALGKHIYTTELGFSVELSSKCLQILLNLHIPFFLIYNHFEVIMHEAIYAHCNLDQLFMHALPEGVPYFYMGVLDPQAEFS